MRPRLKGGYDMVLLVYSDKAGNGELSRGAVTLSTRTRQLKTLFARAGLLRETPRRVQEYE
jgi:hypothetical protein